MFVYACVLCVFAVVEHARRCAVIIIIIGSSSSSSKASPSEIIYEMMMASDGCFGDRQNQQLAFAAQRFNYSTILTYLARCLYHLYIHALRALFTSISNASDMDNHEQLIDVRIWDRIFSKRAVSFFDCSADLMKL